LLSLKLEHDAYVNGHCFLMIVNHDFPWPAELHVTPWKTAGTLQDPAVLWYYRNNDVPQNATECNLVCNLCLMPTYRFI